MSLEQLEWLRTRLQKDDSSKTGYDSSSPEIYEAVAKSSFYGLPLELRRKILILAFGNHTLHFGLLEPNGEQDKIFSDCEPQALRWWSGICMRDPNLSPFENNCLGHPNFKSTEDIGVMGWLCSCRLGFVLYSRCFLMDGPNFAMTRYTEGIDVLYSTNTFHIRNRMLIENLDVLLPSKYLTRIRSLELCGYFYLKNWPYHHPKTALLGYHGLETVLVAIRDCYPSLRKLYLSIDSYDVGAFLDFGEPEGDSIEPLIDVMEKALGIVEEIVFQKHDSLEVEIALSARVLSELRKRGSGEIAPQYPRLSVLQGRDDSKVCNCVWYW
jgi:hypothetical protein